jgi:hypothetical protein
MRRLSLNNLFNQNSANPEDILTALGVSKDDTLFNRSGRISDRQKDILKGERRRRLSTLGIMFVGVMFMVWAFQSFASLTDMPPIVIIFMGIFVIILGIQAYNVLQVSRDLQDDRVESRVGIVTRRSRSAGSNSRIYELIVDGVTLTVSRKIYNAIIHNDTYHIYYAPRSKVLVNAIHHTLLSK